MSDAETLAGWCDEIAGMYTTGGGARPKLRRIAELLRATLPRTIADAPKDGRFLLLYDTDYAAGWIAGKWDVKNDCWNDGGPIELYPTHWLPMPPAPAPPPTGG